MLDDIIGDEVDVAAVLFFINISLYDVNDAFDV